MPDIFSKKKALEKATKTSYDFLQRALSLFRSQRIIWIGFYGSRAFGRNERLNSDYDFYILLDSDKISDQFKLRDLGFSFSIDLTVQYLDELKVMGWHNYQLLNHGIFYLRNWATSRTLHGNNPFPQIAKKVLSDNQIKSCQNGRSLFQVGIRRQVNEHFERIRHRFIKDSNFKNLKSFYNKYFIRILTNILLFHDDIDYPEIHVATYRMIAGLAIVQPYFSATLKKLVKKIFIQKCFENFSQEIQLSLYHQFIHFIAKDRLRLYQQKLS